MSQEINANTEEELLEQISDLVKKSDLIKPVIGRSSGLMFGAKDLSNFVVFKEI